MKSILLIVLALLNPLISISYGSSQIPKKPAIKQEKGTSSCDWGVANAIACKKLKQKSADKNNPSMQNQSNELSISDGSEKKDMPDTPSSSKTAPPKEP